MDDPFLCASSASLLEKKRDSTLELLVALGFCPNLDKFQLMPSQSMVHLGYLWDPINMAIAVTAEKCIKTSRLTSQRLASQITLRQLASLVGLLMSHKQAFPFAPLLFRNLQLSYNKCLMVSKWEDYVTLSKEAVNDLFWWSNNCFFFYLLRGYVYLQ